MTKSTGDLLTVARKIFLTGVVLGGLGVALGAFGAHGLKKLDLPPEGLAWWQTAVEYQFVHALALLGLGAWLRARVVGAVGGIVVAAWCWLVGVAVFSGSLYAMTLGAPRWLGAVTPLGGTALIVGWVWLAACVWRERD